MGCILFLTLVYWMTKDSKCLPLFLEVGHNPCGPKFDEVSAMPSP